MEKHFLFRRTTVTILLALKALLVGAIIIAGVISLYPDEAQYWTWSQALDWGFYSKPPGIAWLIAIGTALWGSTEIGVRFGALFIAFFLALGGYRLARKSGLSEIASWAAALTLAFCPLGIFSSFFATTDGPFVLFWTLACAEIGLAIHRRVPPNYWLIGFLVACGAFFKWPMYHIWMIVLAAMVVYRQFRCLSFFGGVLISLLALAPMVYWNLTHEWATFKHVGTALVGGAEPYRGGIQGNPLDFFGAQIVLYSPILFIFLIISLYKIAPSKKYPLEAVRFWAGISLFILSLHQILSFFMKIQGNWAVYAYPLATVPLCAYLFEHVKWGKKVWAMGIALSIALVAIVIFAPLPYKLSPFRHCKGWKNLAPALEQAGYNAQTDFLFSDNYQMTSILSFYGPKQKRAYFLNLGNRRKNQYSYWPGMDKEQLGSDGWFVVAAPKFSVGREDAYVQPLSAFFERVSLAGIYPLWTIGDTVQKEALILKCEEHNGEKPVVRSSY